VHIEIIINDTVIVPPAPTPHPGVGALATFTGTVRGSENDQPISALVYEAYQPMAETVMHRLLTELATDHPCHSVFVQHRIGVIRVGEAAIHIAVQAKHRAPAFALLAAFMDRLKQDVPIWKTDTLPIN
jgi:molybdopterin synthase catalytic subunit